MKILCPDHKDSNPSMEVYESSNGTAVGWCFVCNSRRVFENDSGQFSSVQSRRNRPTDVPSELERISALPHRIIRGFNLPTDHMGFYILWPTRDYYKRRNFSDNPRYTAPTGVKPPPYVFKGTSDTAIIVEGELNARALYESLETKDTVMSPGSVTNFPSYYKVVQSYYKIERFILVVDHDTPGIVYGTELKNLLLKQGKKAILITCPIDYNDIFCTEGPEAVAKHFKENS